MNPINLNDLTADEHVVLFALDLVRADLTLKDDSHRFSHGNPDARLRWWLLHNITRMTGLKRASTMQAVRNLARAGFVTYVDHPNDGGIFIALTLRKGRAVARACAEAEAAS